MSVPGIFTIKNKQGGPACRQAGQILLIVVLAAVVSLTVGLSAVSRTITNTRVTTEEANSQKALSAAETGVEELVNNSSLLAGGGISSPKQLSNNSSFLATSDPIDGSQILINDGNQILKDDGADIWFTTYPDFGGPQWSGTLTVLWDNNDGCSVSGNQVVNPAIEIIVIQGANRNSPSMTRAVYDVCGGRGNNFSIPPILSDPNKTVNGRVFNNGANVTVTDGFIARVVPLYANAEMGARGSVGLPTQGYVIDSVGTSGNTKRTVRVFRGFPRIPIEYFPYNIFLP